MHRKHQNDAEDYIYHVGVIVICCTDVLFKIRSTLINRTHRWFGAIEHLTPNSPIRFIEDIPPCLVFSSSGSVMLENKIQVVMANPGRKPPPRWEKRYQSKMESKEM